MNWAALKQKSWFKWVSNIYVIILTFYAIWMTFFDANSLKIHNQLNRELKQLKNEAEFFKAEIEKDKKELKSLETLKGQEKYAREHYFMKKEKEEIYIIEDIDSISKN